MEHKAEAALVGVLADLVQEQKEKSFQDPSSATDPEALGILISNYYEWDGLRIMRAFQFALEDANFHTESAMVMEMADRLERDMP
jgi:hypothetical protein